VVDLLGSVRLMVGFDDVKGLFQPKLFYGSMILRQLKIM